MDTVHKTHQLVPGDYIGDMYVDYITVDLHIDRDCSAPDYVPGGGIYHATAQVVAAAVAPAADESAPLHERDFRDLPEHQRLSLQTWVDTHVGENAGELFDQLFDFAD